MSFPAPDSLGPTLCVGEILVEIVATTPGCGFRAPQPLIGPYPSGAPAIFMSQCGRLGGAAALVGCVGDDDFGQLNLDRLRQDGVETGAIGIDPDYPTGSAFVRYRPDGQRDFVFNLAKSAAARFGWTAGTEALCDRAGHLHVMGTALAMASAWEVIDRALPRIKARGGSVSFDPNLRKELLRDPDILPRFARMVAECDLLLPSGAELQQAAGVEDAEAAIAALLQGGVAEIALKQGEAGATVYRRDAPPVHSRAFAVEEIDPTGAGDCFGGAYVTCRRLGLPVAEALTYACAAGARNVTRRGPMEGAGTRAELDAFIAATGYRA
ncbi:tagatose kinase [Salipiger marinus]|uniref:tagatose kinase n=1 Tax=Salipiger marinus TaxID=555512 RepID=UPI00405A2ADB